jgi:hypothetical protein
MDTAFSQLVRVVFEAGLTPGLVEGRWPAFARAFRDFDAVAVAAFTDEDVERLLANARAVAEIGGEAALRSWLAGQDDPPAALRERFAGLGPASAARLAEMLHEPEVCAPVTVG